MCLPPFIIKFYTKPLMKRENYRTVCHFLPKAQQNRTQGSVFWVMFYVCSWVFQIWADVLKWQELHRGSTEKHFALTRVFWILMTLGASDERTHSALFRSRKRVWRQPSFILWHRLSLDILLPWKKCFVECTTGFQVVYSTISHICPPPPLF